MAYEFFDGAEGGGAQTVTSPVLHGIRSYELSPPVDTVQNNAIPAGNRVLAMSFAFRFNTVPGVSANRPVLAEWRLPNGILRFNCTSQRLEIREVDGATALFGPTIVANTWYVVDFSVNSTANPWTFKARATEFGGVWDGTEATLTAARAAADVTGMWIGSGSAGDIYTAYYDDWQISDRAFPLGPASFSSYPRTRRGLAVQATIDGKPVDLDDDWVADAATNWGSRSFSGRIPETVTWAEQEAPLVLWLDDGTPLWEGNISLDPQPSRGKLGVKAEGDARRIEADTTRMFYRIDGGEPWVDTEGEPHDYNYQGSEKYDIHSGPGRLAWNWGNGSDAFVIGDKAGFGIWVEGSAITRYSFVGFGNGGTQFDLQTQSGPGPSGSAPNIAFHAAGTGGVDVTYAADVPGDDMLQFSIRANAAITPAGRRRFRVKTIKVYGRTIDDDFSASEVVADVGSIAGFDVRGVVSNGMKILPLDWDDDHTALLDYMADLCDWYWAIHGDEMTFGPYETTWTGYTSDGVEPIWENQPRANRVKVPFTYLSGREGSRTATPAVDPFPGREVVHTTQPIEDSQRNGDLAAAYAAAQVEYWAARRVAGRVNLGRVFSEAGEQISGYKVREGQLFNPADRPDLGPQRIVGVSYRAHERVTIDLNEDFNVIRMLDSIRPKRGRRRRKKRRGR